MEGFTPTFFLQLVIAIGSGGIAYGVLRADLKNLIRSVDEDRRLREEHAKEDDNSFHEIRNELQSQHGRLARVEAANDLAERFVSALKTR